MTALNGIKAFPLESRGAFPSVSFEIGLTTSERILPSFSSNVISLSFPICKPLSEMMLIDRSLLRRACAKSIPANFVFAPIKPYVFSFLQKQESKHRPRCLANVRYRPVSTFLSLVEKTAPVNSGERSPSFNVAPDTSNELHSGSSFLAEVGYP